MKNHASKKCVVPNCSTTSSNKQKLGKSLFKFPARGTEKHQQWLKQLGLEQNGRVPSWKMHICSDHFAAEHYEQNYRHELMGTNYPVRFLRPNAVPIPFDASNAKTKTPTKSPKKSRKKRKLVDDSTLSSEPCQAADSSGQEEKDSPGAKKQRDEFTSAKDDEGDAIAEELGPISMCEVVHESSESGGFAPEIVSVYSLENQMRTYSRDSPAEPQKAHYYQDEIFKAEEKKEIFKAKEKKEMFITEEMKEIFKAEEKKKEKHKVYSVRVVQRKKTGWLSEISDSDEKDAVSDSGGNTFKAENKEEDLKDVQQTKMEPLFHIPNSALFNFLENFPRDNWFVKSKEKVLTAICVEDNVVQKCLTLRLWSGVYNISVLGKPITVDVFHEGKAIPLIKSVEHLKLIMSSLQAYKVCIGSGEQAQLEEFKAESVTDFKLCHLTNKLRCETCRYLVTRTPRCMPCATQRIMLARMHTLAKKGGALRSKDDASK